jgi:hypothetical protein
MMFLKLKPWVLFLLISTSLFLKIIQLYLNTILGMADMMLIYRIQILINIIAFTSFQLWIFSIITVFRKEIPLEQRPNLVGYYIALIILVVHEILSISPVVFARLFGIDATAVYKNYELYRYIIIPIVTLYNMNLTARILLPLERGRRVRFSETIIYSLGFLFTDIGLWWLQPRINKIANSLQGSYDPNGPIDQGL